MSQRTAPDGRSENKPGAALRTLRRQRGWTLNEMGERSGLAVSTLSKIENGRMSLSYDKLVRVCEGLQIDIAELFATDHASAPGRVNGRRSVTRAGEGRAIDTTDYLQLFQAAELLNKRFVPIVADLHARTLEEFGELIRHSGEEYAYVLEGAVELHTDIYAPTRLEVGDSIYFDSGMGHAYLAAAPGRCRVLAICSASEAQIVNVFADKKKPSPAVPAKSAARGKPAPRRVTAAKKVAR